MNCNAFYAFYTYRTLNRLNQNLTWGEARIHVQAPEDSEFLKTS